MCGSEQFHIVSFDGEVFADKLSAIQVREKVRGEGIGRGQ
jgi:hypothetical protein